MSSSASIRHTVGIDVFRPLSVTALISIMTPLILLPLGSIFFFGTNKGLSNFWSALVEPDAIFALKLSLITSFWATIFNTIFGVFAGYVISHYDFRGKNVATVLISLPTAIPTAVAGFALLLVWGPYGVLGRFLASRGIEVMFTGWAIILASIFVTFPLAFGVVKPVYDSMGRSLEETAATIGANRWQTFWHVTLPSLKGAIVTGALLTFARSVGEFGSTILVSGNLAGRTQTAPLYIFAKFNEGQVEAANAIAIVLALLSFAIFSLLFLARDFLELT